MRYVRSYIEHKCLMEKRIAYLFNHYGIVNSSIVEEISKIYHKSEPIMTLSLKFNLSKNSELLENISDMIKSINVMKLNVY